MLTGDDWCCLRAMTDADDSPELCPGPGSGHGIVSHLRRHDPSLPQHHNTHNTENREHTHNLKHNIQIDTQQYTHTLETTHNIHTTPIPAGPGRDFPKSIHLITCCRNKM